MSLAYKLIVFDFDGTLADSLGTVVATYNRIAPGLGLRPLLDLEAARSTPTRKLLKQLGIRLWRLRRVVRAYQAAVAADAPAVRLHDGIGAVLAGLHAAGHRLGVLSSNREDNIRACLRANGAEHLFGFVIGYPRLFGKARALRRILRAERLSRADVLFVGDELRDVEAGRKVRVATAAVTWGFHAEGLLAGAGPTYLVRRPAELLGLPVAGEPGVSAPG